MPTDPHQRVVILADGFILTRAESLLKKRRWTTRWSDGGNIPFGLSLPRDHYFAKSNYHFYAKGLWAFADPHRCQLVEGWGEQHAGLKVGAVTGKHAISLLQKLVS